MSTGKRIIDILDAQWKTVKDRFERLDQERSEYDALKRHEDAARRELDDPVDMRKHLRSPEVIAAGIRKNGITDQPETSVRTPPVARPVDQSMKTGPNTSIPAAKEANVSENTLAFHFKVLGLEEGADLPAVNSAYNKLMERCDPDRFVADSEEQKLVIDIRDRVKKSYVALRDAIDPTAGRFDKLEF